MTDGNTPLDKRAFLLKLVLAEALARPGEGPLASRVFVKRKASPQPRLRQEVREGPRE